MRRKHRRGYQGRFTRLASRYRSLYTLVWTFLAFLSVAGFNGSAHAQSATYRVTFEGKFTASALASGVSVPSGEHFTTLIGAVHNGGATFWSSGAVASAGVEAVAELGNTATFESEIKANMNAVAVIEKSLPSGGTPTATVDFTVTTAHPRVTLLTMIAPSPDWFVGVSGLSLLDAQGDWLASHSVDLFPYDAGTEEGTEFSLSNAATSPQGTITSIKGTGKFSNEPIATLSFTRQSVTPEITSATTFAVHEATTAVATLTAEDQDSAAADLAWSKAGGADAGQFTLSSAGVLNFLTAPDYESLVDADGDNVYEVTVQVSDGTNPATAAIEVTVVNVDEAGSVSLFPALLQVRTVVRTTLSDPDGVRSLAWQWAKSAAKSNWVPISGATRADYMPVDGDLGMYLRAVTTYTDGEGSGKTAEGVSDNVVGTREPAPELSVKVLVPGRSKAWGIAFAPDGTMLFTERAGKLSSRLADGTVRRVTADFGDLSIIGNNGLMGIVVDPFFITNRRFYTCQGHTGPEVQVIAWTIDAAYTTATRVSDPLVEGIASGGSHNGCRLRFGPDGYLYIATGDTETTGTVPQDLTALGGKVLRVDPTTGAAPPDNPISGSIVYTYGHRNVQGLALRPGTRQMWSVEHGPTVDDEINLLVAGANYGWDPAVTDAHGDPLPGYDDTVPMTDLREFPDAKVAKWSSGDPTLATAGGIFLEGDQWGLWAGRLAVATLKNRTLHIFEFTEDGNFASHVIPPELDHTYDRLRTPMLSPDGALYIATDEFRRTVILRVTPQQAPEFAAAMETRQVPENTAGTAVVATVEATDYNHDELTYTLGGTDVKSFYILDENIGELRVPSTTQLDYETKQTYEVTVTATDDQNTSDTVTLTIEVTDVEHEGTVTLSSTQPRVGSPFQASLSDPDGGVTATTWKWERSDDGVTGWEDIDGAQSASYTPGADDAGKYLRATVTYTNTHGSGKTAQSVTSSAVGAALNSNPEFPSASLVRRVAEHTAAGQPIDSPVEADDADGDPLQYALSGMDADLFDINSSTGQLLTKAALDYEVANEYEVTVSVSDGKDTNGVPDDNEGDDSVTVPIKVINVDEPGSVSLFPSRLRVRTVVRATLTDPDGDLSAVSWRWAESSDKTNWTNIDGATEADYLPTEATQGKYLRAKATSYGDGEGSGKTAQTESNAVVGEREPAPELITVVSFVSGLSVPWGMTFAPDGTMLFTERGGRLGSRLTDGTVQPVSADFGDLLVSGEAGLMAIAADPAFAANRRFYTCQAHTGPEVQVIAWTFNDDTYTAATRVADPLVGNIPAASRHSGCRLRFGPQGYLWIATGDATVGTAPQDLNSLGGKVLRVDAATGAAAAGNPFGSRLYTYGHRNVQGLARRPGTNQMWSVEHGPRLDDEINLLSAGGNYGWDPVPGYDEGVPMTDLAKFSGAVEARWSSGNPTLATSGGIFLEGAQWGRWDGRLAVATLKGSSLRVFEFTDDGAFVSQVVVRELDGRYGRLRTPLLGPDGALYVTTSNGRGQDKILRVSGSRAPAFLTDTETRNVDENNDISTFVAKVLALDSDGDTLTYTLSGPDAESFSIPDAAVGAMWANVAFDYETKRSYEVIVTATDPQALNDSTTLTITVTDTDEPPAVPGAPTVSAKAGTTDSLDVIWTAPANAGPAITDYDVQYRAGTSGGWTDRGHNGTATTATITGLAEGTSHQVQVRATNDEGTGDWSDSGTGSTDASPLPDTPALDVAMVKGDELELRFDRPLDETSVPAPEDFTVVLDDGAGTSLPRVGGYAVLAAVGARGTPLTVTAVEVRGTTVVLTLEREVAHGTRVTVSYTPGAAPLRDEEGVAVPPIGGEAAVETALSVADARADEGDDVTFRVTLSPAVASPVTVDWVLAPGSAAPGTDYTGPLAGSLTIEGGGTAGTISVPTAQDAAVEGDETFTLTLTEPADFPHWALLKTATAAGTIEDDDDDGDPPPPPPPPPPPGGGPSPPPSNRPPVATEEMTAQILELGDTLELDATEHFRDPDRRRMTFEAESADSAVATVEVEDSAVTVRGVGHGAAEVTVTAVDHRRAQAAQSFEVTVGRLVSFASEEVAAAEGGTAALVVVISRPRDAATSLDYVVGPDDDPATADADADDHDGMAGTVVIAARATEATIAIAVRDDDDIEPPRETFAVTLKRSAEQARDFGLGVAAVRVRIDEGVCDRTPQVRDALRRSLPCAWVSDSDLAGVRTLDLSDTGLAALRPADLSGLRNLRALDMSGNSLASLPDGVFAGLGALSEVRLQDNPGSPFTLRVELARTDGPASAPSPARLATRVRQGAPFPMRAGLRAVGGALSSDASVVATGMTESAPVSVARTSAGATRVELASTPLVPDTRCGRFGHYLCYRGFATAIGDPLILFKDPPEVRESVPATDLAAENDSVRISLSELFAAADGGPLSYSARSSDPGLAEAEVRGGVLIVVSGEDGREGTATITVTATDADGLSAELTFEVTLESMPRGFMRGWRRALIEQLIE